MQRSVTEGVLPARRISCLPFYQAEFDNWTAMCKVSVSSLKACIGSRGVAPPILNLDTKVDVSCHLQEDA